MCENFNYLTVAVHKIQSGDRQTDRQTNGQLSFSNRVPFFGNGTQNIVDFM